MTIQPFQYKAGRICTRCIMDDTVQGIIFDEQGECTFCKIHDELAEKFPLNENTTREIEAIVAKIKKEGKGKKYDCVLGVSGGRDSTFMLYTAVKLGLRPLAVHFDNGWNSDLAVQNIKNVCNKFNIDLYTHVADWEEFKDLQRAFLLASVPDAEVPTDWVIFSVMYKAAKEEGVKYIIQGHSFRTEGTTPLTWTYMDGRYVNYIQKKFGTLKIKSFPVMTMFDYLYYTFVKRVKQIRLLYYIPYDEKAILNMLTNEVGWQDYGGKHHESKYTGFFQSYILTRKFNIDKRKLHYSALIRSGQKSRAEALEAVHKDPYTGGQETMDYCLKKLGFTPAAFEQIMNNKPKLFLDYRSYYQLIKFFEKPLRWGAKVGIIPDVIIKKFFGFSK
ncbi:MAG: N-acetyl sugar amidotransferase [Saprospiraceae bacterium]|nr:N-acetyl sugar amidotransferase [Saprospiraceae bacterium]